MKDIHGLRGASFLSSRTDDALSDLQVINEALNMSCSSSSLVSSCCKLQEESAAQFDDATSSLSCFSPVRTDGCAQSLLIACKHTHFGCYKCVCLPRSLKLHLLTVMCKDVACFLCKESHINSMLVCEYV
jgi:hypothetical protein